MNRGFKSTFTKIWLFVLLTGTSAQAQVFLSTFSGTQSKANLNADYFVYSTHAGNGSTTQYAANPTTKAEFDKLFNTDNSHTTLYSKGRVSNMLIFDWDDYSDLTGIGISVPNSGNYFSIKIQGTFIPTENGNYTFAIDGDDGADLYIDNTLVVAYYGAHGLAESALGTQTGSVSLVAGKSYRFELRLQEGAGGEGFRFYWKSPTNSGVESNGYKKTFIQRAEELYRDVLLDGSSSARAAPSAVYIKNKTGTNTDGVYWINLPVVGPTQIYCIMNSAIDGGGWMMMMKATTGYTFDYESSHWTTRTTLNTTDNNRNNGDAKFNTMNYYAAKDMMALWPDIPSNYNSSTTGGSINLSSSYNNWCWLQNNFNNGIRIVPINFWNTVDRLFLGDANNFAGKGTAFSTQTDVRFYGFNFRNTPAVNGSNTTLRVKVRWGFGWNENGGGLYPNGNMESDDISGGIGVKSDRVGSYSAGDIVNCCQSTTGINRTARVEIYIR